MSETVSVHFQANAPTLTEQLSAQGLRFRKDIDADYLQDLYDELMLKAGAGIIPREAVSGLAQRFSDIVARRVEPAEESP